MRASNLLGAVFMAASLAARVPALAGLFKDTDQRQLFAGRLGRIGQQQTSRSLIHRPRFGRGPIPRFRGSLSHAD
jgi:hypothetical protein